MAVCYFNNNYDKKMQCEYEIKEDGIKIVIDYDIDDEIKAINGLKTFGTKTKFDNRDILIIDYKNKKNYLLKQAYYNGHQSVWGSPDGGVKSTFFSQVYFSKNNYEDLTDLKPTPKVNKIKIYSKTIIDFIGCPSLKHIESDDDYVFTLKKEKKEKEESEAYDININSNNIKTISICDTWNSCHNNIDKNILIDLSGYIEIDLINRINYDECYEYIKEIQVFIQLLLPNKLFISKIVVFVDEKNYELFLPLPQNTINPKNVELTVEDDLSLFLKRCYQNIPYRNSKNAIRNIQYIVLNTSRGLEDNFLMFYRFIESYYKNKPIKNINKTFISYSILNNYKLSAEMLEVDIEKLSQEIISLRNHYVHSGYYIKNESLKISFQRINKEKSPKDYTANNVDFDWLYNRTKILYVITIDIIFKNMLKYDKYNYSKHF